MLQIKLFGTLQIGLGDFLNLRFRTRKAQALLIYLAVTERSWTREALATLFWPETNDARARKNLRDILPTLRRQLGDYLLLDDEIIGLDPASHYNCDVTLFSKALEQQLPTVETTTLVATLALYQGQFLENYNSARISADFELWMLHERDRLHHLAVIGFTTLCRRQEEMGAYEAALATNRQLLKLAPWDEAIHRQQMLLLARSGQRGAALAHYEVCRQMLADELDVEPDLDTLQLYQAIQKGGYSSERTALVPISPPTNAIKPSATFPDSIITLPVATPRARQPHTVDWGNAPEVYFFHGRAREQTQLQSWLWDSQCRIIALLGMGGIGKTTLAAKVARSTTTSFEAVLWRSLVNSPPLAEIVHSGLELLDPQSLSDLPASLDEQLNHLFVCLQQRRCLFILDNLESVMREDRPGTLRNGYEAYEQLLRRFGESTHQSCLVLTSRECPQVVGQLQAGNPAVKLLQLQGLADLAGQALFYALTQVEERPAACDAAGTAVTLEIVHRYSGNPLALKLVATSIRDYFGGDPSLFLSEEPLIFDDIRSLLDQQFARLSPHEEELLLWLAIERQPVTFQQLQANLVQPPTTRILLEALRALERRSLIEKAQGQLWLQNVLMEYATDRLTTRFCADLERWEEQTSQALSWTTSYFNRFAMKKAQSIAEARSSQRRLLLQPVAQHLYKRWGPAAAETRLKAVLNFLQRHGQRIAGYATANLIHLYHELKLEVTGTNFSGLVIQQADLRHVAAQQVNFSNADLAGTIFMENIHEVRALAVSPDGLILANANQNGQIDIRQMHNLQLFDTLKGHRGLIFSIVFSPNGQLLASGDRQSIVIWQKSAAEQWRPCFTFDDTETTAVRLAFSPDSRFLAAARGGGTISVWEIHAERNGWVAQLYRRFNQTIDQPVTPIAFSPDGKTLASGAREVIQLWDMVRGVQRQSLYGHTERLQSLLFSPTESLLASGGTDGTVRLWDTEQGKQVALLDGHRVRILSMAFSPDGRMVATADLKVIRLWKIEASEDQGTLVQSDAQARAVHLYYVWNDHKHFITALAFHPNGQTLVSASLDETVRLWAVQTGQRLRSLFGYQSAFTGIDIDGSQRVVTGNINGTIQLWQIDHRQPLQRISRLADYPGPVLSVAFSPDDQYVAAVCAEDYLRLWHSATATQRFVIHDPSFDFGLGQLAFSPDGALVAATCGDRAIRLWRCTDGKLLYVLSGETIQFRCVAFSPDGRMCVGGTQEGRIYAWDLGIAETSMATQPNAVLDFVVNKCITGIKFSREGKKLIYSSNNAVFIMDLTGQEQRLILAGDHKWNRALALSCHNLIAVGGDSATIQLHDAQSGQPISLLQGHRAVVSALVFDRNGALLYSVSEDGELKIWDVMRQICLDTVPPVPPYAEMNITGTTGISEAQKSSLRALGAVGGE